MKLTKDQKNRLKKVAQKYSLRLVLLFGSYARGQEKFGSDFDVAVLSNDKNIHKKQVELIRDLDKVFEKDLDLSIINKADLILKFQLANEAKLLYGSENDFINFKVRAILEYMDNKKFFDLQEKYIKEKLKQYD